MSLATKSDVEISITRLVHASADEVFEAWLSPDHLSRWWGPREGRVDWTTPHVETDPRPGGAYRACTRSPRGDAYWMRGTYREIEPPRRLVFTHGWENEQGEVEHEGLISVELTASGEDTKVAFRKSGFPSASARDGEIEGWNECLERLVQHFAGRPLAASDEEEIRGLAQAWGKALEARDLDALMAGYGPDILLFDAIPPFRMQGLEAYRKLWEACLPCFPAKFRSVHRDLEVTVGGDVAFAHCLHHIEPIGEPHPAGETWLRVTLGYRRIDGEWRVVHEHVSVPFDPETGKASYIKDPSTP